MTIATADAPAATRERAVVPRTRGSGRVIGLAAHVGMQNIGDEMLFASALEHYRGRLPGARFVAFTMDADDTMARHHVDEAYPIRPARRATPGTGNGNRIGEYFRDVSRAAVTAVRELRFSLRSVQRLRQVDLLIVPGSSQFIDAYGGPWGFPLTLLRWTVLARLAGVPICFLSLGAENVHHSLSRWMIRRTVHLADFITVRDDVSRRRLAAQGVRRELPVMPDLVLAYPVSADGQSGPRAKTLGINTIPYYHGVYWRASDEARYRRYVDAMVELIVEALQRGHSIVLYAMVEWADRVPAQQIVEQVRKRCGADAAARIHRPEVHTFDDLWAVLSRVDWVVASRYHGVATALLMRKPVIGLAYEEKTADLMADLGVGTYAVGIDEADGPTLSTLLHRLESNDGAIRSTLDAAARSRQAAVVAQFDDVLEKYAINRKES